MMVKQSGLASMEGAPVMLPSGPVALVLQKWALAAVHLAAGRPDETNAEDVRLRLLQHLVLAAPPQH